MSKYGTPEIYSRFLRKDWLRASNTFVHTNAFEPRLNKINERLEVSCFETQCLNSDDVKNIAISNNISLNNKLPIGFCSILDYDFPFEIISFDKNYSPERHIDIIGWENSKIDQKVISTILADKASLIIELF